MCVKSVVQACLYSSNLTEWAGTSREKKDENSYKEQITLSVIAQSANLTFPIYSKFRSSMMDWMSVGGNIEEILKQDDHAQPPEAYFGGNDRRSVFYWDIIAWSCQDLS